MRDDTDMHAMSLRLAAQRHRTVALILDTDPGSFGRSTRLASTCAAVLAEHDLRLNVAFLFPGQDQMVPVRQIVTSGTAGALILTGTTEQDRRVPYLTEHGIPFVTYGRTGWTDSHSWYDFDNAMLTRLAFDRLAENGRSKILMIPSWSDRKFAWDILAEARASAARTGLKLELLEGIDCDDMEEDITLHTYKALHDDPVIDGLLTFSVPAALAAMVAIEAAGRVIGRDFDLVSKEPSRILHKARPAIISCLENVGRAGVFLAEAAAQCLLSPSAAPVSRLDVPGAADLAKGETALAELRARLIEDVRDADADGEE